jgi:hypothetical protein
MFNSQAHTTIGLRTCVMTHANMSSRVKGKRKVVPVLNQLSTTPWRLTGGECSASRPRPLYYGERAPGPHWIGGWEGPRAGLDDIENRKFLTLPGLELRPLDRPARSQSLYRVRYPGSQYVKGKGKVKLYLYRPWRPLGLADGGKFVSPMCRPLFTPRKIPGTHFLEAESNPGAMVRLEGLGKLKKSTSSGTRTGDLPACSIVPQPTTLSRAPICQGYKNKL